MSPEPDMIAASTHLHRFSLDDVDRMLEAGVLREDDRVELLMGVLYDMSPQSSHHAATIHLALAALQACLPAQGWHVRVQVPLRLASDSQPEPDLAVVSGTPRSWIDRHPDHAALVVEVADSSIEHDRGRKAPLYARAGIQAYWILEPAHARVRVFEGPDPSSSSYRLDRVLGRTDSIVLPREIAGRARVLATADLLPDPDDVRADGEG